MKSIFSLFHQIFAHDHTEKEQQLIRKHDIVQFFFILGTIFFLPLFFLLLISNIGFLFRLNISLWHVPIAFWLSSFFLVYLISKKIKENKLFYFFLSFFIWFGLTGVFLYLSGQVFDLSYDGQAYHQEAVLQLKNGWNPLYETQTPERANKLDRWLNHYPKAAWISSTSFLLFFNSIEVGKASNFFLMCSAFFLIMSFLLSIKGIKIFLATLVSLLVALNPVSIYQSLSYYLDGQLLNLLTCLVALSGMLFMQNSTSVLIVMSLVLIYLINLKLTAGIYGLLFIAGFLLMLWMANKVNRTFKVAIVIGLASLIGFFVLGFNPYVTNILSKGHPFYPALGEKALDFRTPNIPENFTNDSSTVILFKSIFSRSENVRGPGSTATYKTPFTFTEKELHTFWETNPKEGGFGVLFSGAMLLCLGIFLSEVITSFHFKKTKLKHVGLEDLHRHEMLGIHRRSSKIFGLTLLCCGIIFLSSITNPAASLARYIPQFWLVPIVLLLYGLHSSQILTKVFSYALLVTLFVNNGLILYQNYSHTISQSNQLRTKLTELASNQESEKVYLGEFRSSGEHKLQSSAISYQTISTESECIEKERLGWGSIILICK